jgi:Rrf2 family protein
MLSVSEDIAVKAMISVAAAGGKYQCSINKIAEREKLSREYLAKILKRLVQKGLLISSLGLHGGYKLAKPARDISFLDILEAIEGPYNYIVQYGPEELAIIKNNPAFKFWTDVHKMTRDMLNNMTLDKIDYKKYYPDFE